METSSQAIMGRLAADFAGYDPEVRVEVSLEDRNVGVIEEGYDLAIRVNRDPIVRLSSLFVVREAACTGIGTALLPLSMINKDIADGRLTVRGDLDDPDIDLRALYQSPWFLNCRVSAFVGHFRCAFPNAITDDLARFIDD